MKSIEVDKRRDTILVDVQITIQNYGLFTTSIDLVFFFHVFCSVSLSSTVIDSI